ncbi:MAG: UDP-N-acetylmuramoyl-L-alanyl-D-glutamate--2,6-diaminopimelate ligase [Saprospiraceae bacterium]|nr:UDP-N-acetylmuramoyl-L-alanyl-D-glutamate--2,6-diaminopimelate ligase [Saprospiraceae bacterium]
MKSLAQILVNLNYQLIKGDLSQLVSTVEIDSRLMKDKGVFIAIKGLAADGHDYIEKAIGLGATAIIFEVRPEVLQDHVTYVQVENSRAVTGLIASRFFDQPSEKLALIGVTGTNGKTSVVQMSHRLFSRLGYKSGMLSTIENKIGDEILPASLTTPDAVSLQKMLAKMVAEKCEYAFMEVSSHALDQFRVNGCHFKIAVFTNITHDHLDYHGSFSQYIKAKKLFFDGLAPDSFALINLDDRNAEVMVQNCAATVVSYALKKASAYKGKILDNTSQGLHLVIDGVEVHSQIVGSFNASNLLAVYAIARIAGQEKIDVLTNISSLSSPPGRMEAIKNPKRNVVAFVDYAHTPDALQNVLQTINEIKNNDQEVITVIGCGGNRDALKRPVMAKIASQFSDRVILTSDNPRFEDPDQIIREMEAGIPDEGRKSTLSITNRREAIKVACALAAEGAIILVAGKGHENYQEIKGVRNAFDDREILREYFVS